MDALNIYILILMSYLLNVGTQDFYSSLLHFTLHYITFLLFHYIKFVLAIEKIDTLSVCASHAPLHPFSK